MQVLRLNVAARSPSPLRGNKEVLPSVITVSLDELHTHLESFREQKMRFKDPPDPELKGWRATAAADRHQSYLNWAKAVTEVELALEMSEDIICDERARIMDWCWGLILTKRFVAVTCPACCRVHAAEECELKEWSVVADPLAGIGGKHLLCPAGHTLLALKTWVA
jgi:hypothetical protein